MKRIISVVLSITIILGVTIMGTASSFAASNSSTSFKEGRIVACGKYLFSIITRKGSGTEYLYRTNKSGKSAKLISKKVIAGTSLYTYNSKVYFKESKKIYCYNAKTLKKSVFKTTSDEISGICTKGLITESYSKGIRLMPFSGKIKTIAGKNYNFAGANKTYIFYTKTQKFISSNNTAKMRMYRYTVKSGARKTLGTFTTSNNSYADVAYDIKAVKFHAFSKYNVFICGSYGGSAGIFVGDTFSMTSSGTKIKKIKSKVNAWLMPGKSCIYISESNGKGIYKVSTSAKVSKKTSDKTNMYMLGTTSSNYSVVAKKASGSSYDVYVNRSVAVKATKKAISAKSLIKSSDPKDAFVSSVVRDVVGNMALVRSVVYTYDSRYHPIGWRPAVIRYCNYIVNVKTGAKVKI